MLIEGRKTGSLIICEVTALTIDSTIYNGKLVIV